MKIQNDKYYIIRHVPTGLLKVGGQNANFNKVGKIWRGSTIKNHLRMFDYLPGNNLTKRVNHIWEQLHMPVEECVIIEVELIPTDSQALENFITEEME